jgi:hypothetical protein
LPCGATGQRRDRSLPRPTWLPDGRSWVNSSSMSELGIVKYLRADLKLNIKNERIFDNIVVFVSCL